MDDMIVKKTGESCLFDVASDQKGYFTSRQATACGITHSLLAYHAQHGRYERVRRGLYRLTSYPPSLNEEIMVGWLAVGRDIAVASHQSALALHDLSDVIADHVHMTVPRGRRDREDVPGVRVHTTTRSFEPRDLSVREGIRVTSPIRTVLDIDELGVSLEHVEAAARETIQRGQATPAMFFDRAMRYAGRFRNHLMHGQVVL